MPPIILGPQLIGTTRAYEVALTDRSGNPFAFSGSETLTAAVTHRGSSLFSPTAVILSATGGTVTLTVDNSNTTGQKSGYYPITLTVTSGSEPLAGLTDAYLLLSDPGGSAGPLAGHLTTTDNARRALAGLDLSDAHAVRITDMIGNLSRAALRWMNRRHFLTTSVVDTFDGGAQFLWLEPPVQSIASVVVDGITWAAGDYSYYPETGALYRVDRCIWPSYKRRSVVVTYTSGQTEIPDDVHEGLAVALRHAFMGSKQDPTIKSLSVGDAKVDYGSTPSLSLEMGLPYAALDYLAPYRVNVIR
jgi:hypothetical protein